MKRFKKITTLFLALIMILSMATTAFAETGTNTNDGKITINNAIEDVTYSVYQIMKLESFDTVNQAYTYKAASDTWNTWLKTQTTYVNVDAQGYVTWVNGADAEAFAKAALTYAKNSSIAATKSATATGTTVEFTALNLGYYLVDSSLGTLCLLNTTDKEAKISEKNDVPTSNKMVKGDDGQWGDTNTARIGGKVEYKVEITAKKGAQGYVLHDTMSEGLSFNKDVVVKAGETALTEKTDYNVNNSPTDGCTFEITFTETYLNKITADTTIVVTYSATLKENAVVAGDGNTNIAKLEYGEKNANDEKLSTPEDKTTTYTYKFDLVKTDKDGKLLTNAEFELYESDKTTKIALIKIDDNTYRVAKTGEAGVETIVVTDGDVTIKGLENGTYYLKETKAPNGYNLLTEMQGVTIENTNLDATVSAGTYVSGGVQVVNKSGSILPGTGGMGTTLFYVIGGIMVLAAVVLLFAKKRMSVNK